ncbi:MAG: 16S rRNA processing protein RimM [Desulfatitalea sp.]|nr:16S rRNA processing protein RimM [Desulfatitalea sp.]MBI5896962.1 16S rRNA processing protein RimM [Desulfobacterales bacterium]
MKSSNSSIAPGELVQIGKIIGAHGIGGAVRVYSYAESPECFARHSALVLMDAQGNVQPCEIVWSQAHKQVVRLALEGITHREQAEAMKGWGVFIAKKDLPPLEADTYYWSDLIGMAVYTTEGECLGQVEQIIPTGANDVYVVKTPPGHAVEEILLPAIESVIIEIDVPGRRMQVQLPEGLI